jgi:hypothetical protein
LASGPFAIDHDKGVINLLEATFERPRCDALVSRLLDKVRLLRADQAQG